MNKRISLSLWFLVGITALALIMLWLDIRIPPFYTYSDKFDLNKKVQKFNISLSKGHYRLGFAIGKQDLIGKKNDGKYLFEYYCKNKLVRKTYNIGRKNDKIFHDAKKNDEVTYDAPGMYYLVILDELNMPDDIPCKNFKLKITTEENFSLFKDLNISNPVTFYVRKEGKYVVALEKNLKTTTNEFRKKYPRDFENSPIGIFYDDNATHIEMMKALSQKDLQKFKTILHKYDLNTSVKIGYDKYGKFTKRTPIIYAAYYNDLPTIKYLLSHGADINYQDYITKTPLQYAIENNSTTVVKYLLEHKADKKKACFVHEYKTGSRSRLTPLAFAIKNEYYELFKILLEHGFRDIDLNCKGIDMEDESPFSIAIAKTEGYAEKKGKNNLGQFKRDPNFHIYYYLYKMNYPVRFLRLYKKYGLRGDKGYLLTQKGLDELYDGCKQGSLIGLRCRYIVDSNIEKNKFNQSAFFKAVGYANRQKTKKRSK
jgi:ankyrin repeat protein